MQANEVRVQAVDDAEERCRPLLEERIGEPNIESDKANLVEGCSVVLALLGIGQRHCLGSQKLPLLSL